MLENVKSFVYKHWKLIKYLLIFTVILPAVTAISFHIYLLYIPERWVVSRINDSANNNTINIGDFAVSYGKIERSAGYFQSTFIVHDAKLKIDYKGMNLSGILSADKFNLHFFPFKKQVVIELPKEGVVFESLEKNLSYKQLISSDNLVATMPLSCSLVQYFKGNPFCKIIGIKVSSNVFEYTTFMDNTKIVSSSDDFYLQLDFADINDSNYANKFSTTTVSGTSKISHDMLIRIGDLVKGALPDLDTKVIKMQNGEKFEIPPFKSKKGKGIVNLYSSHYLRKLQFFTLDKNGKNISSIDLLNSPENGSKNGLRFITMFDSSLDGNGFNLDITFESENAKGVFLTRSVKAKDTLTGASDEKNGNSDDKSGNAAAISANKAISSNSYLSKILFISPDANALFKDSSSIASFFSKIDGIADKNQKNAVEKSVKSMLDAMIEVIGMPDGKFVLNIDLQDFSYCTVNGKNVTDVISNIEKRFLQKMSRSS